jgi:hypothetical protein
MLFELDVFRRFTTTSSIPIAPLPDPSVARGMTSITRNLPFFIRDPAVGIIGQVSRQIPILAVAKLTPKAEMLHQAHRKSRVG